MVTFCNKLAKGCLGRCLVCVAPRWFEGYQAPFGAKFLWRFLPCRYYFAPQVGGSLANLGFGFGVLVIAIVNLLGVLGYRLVLGFLLLGKAVLGHFVWLEFARL